MCGRSAHGDGFRSRLRLDVSVKRGTILQTSQHEGSFTMVLLQLCTLQQLMDSGFGRPFPRHGLQLLFWFANDCLTCELVRLESVMTLVSDCQPENGCYGFHAFGNIEEILPVLSRSRRIRRRYAYFEVGNLNTETHPGSADLPAYVRENYELEGSSRDDNVDRLVIGYHVNTRVVDVLFVLEHDAATTGRFRHDTTYQITWDLMQVLQNPGMDLSSFLTLVGYYQVVQVDAGARWGQYQDPELVFNVMTGTFTQMNEAFGIFPDTSNHFINSVQSNYHQQGGHFLHTNSRSNRKSERRKPKDYWRSDRLEFWSPHHYPASPWGSGRGGNGGWGNSLIRFLLGVGALCLAAKCLSWCVKSWKNDICESLLKMELWKKASLPRTHVMLDYVY